MTTDAAAVWPVRLLRVASLLMLGGAVLVWVAPLSVPGKNLQPFGCGSPASPMKGQLANLICSYDITGARYAAFGLLGAASLLLVMSELVAPRLAGAPALRGLAVVLPIALPVAALSAAALFSPVGTEAADGSLIRCGTALDPSNDPFVRGTCGHLPERQKTLALGGVALSVFLVGAGAYVTSGAQHPRDKDNRTTEPGDQPAVTEPDPDIEVPQTRRSRL